MIKFLNKLLDLLQIKDSNNSFEEITTDYEQTNSAILNEPYDSEYFEQNLEKENEFYEADSERNGIRNKLK